MKVVAIVTARSGSKGIPGKNLIEIDGESLVFKAVDAALKAGIEDVYLSTDSKTIADEGLKAGANVPVLRPDELATSTSKSIDAVKHMLEYCDDKYDSVFVIQPSSPFRTPEDLRSMNDILQDNHDKFDGVASVTRIDEPHPYKITWKNSDNLLEPIIKDQPIERSRQILKPAYRYNGIGYLVKMGTLLSENKIIPNRVFGYEIPVERSINLDTEWDMIMMKHMLVNNKITLKQGE